MKAWTEAELPSLEGVRALVTGAASGLGLETARALAAQGAHVLLVDRDEQAAMAALERIREATPAARLEFLALDLSSQAAIAAFSARLVGQGAPLDLLINNAGIQPLAERRTTVDGFELTFGIGHLDHFALTARLWPLLMAARAPRVVTVSSVMHRVGSFDWDDLQMERGYWSQRPYNQTKLANLLFARELQRRVDAARLHLKSVAVHPGVAKTGIGANRARLGALSLMDRFVGRLIDVANATLGQSAREGAAVTLYAATAEAVEGGGFYGPSGFGETRGPPGRAAVRGHGADPELAGRLWRVSEALTGVSLLRA